MPKVPSEAKEFTEYVAQAIQKMRPEFFVENNGPNELLVNFLRLDLEDLKRMIAHEPDRGTDIVEDFLDKLFSDDNSQELDHQSFDEIRAQIMPRIQPVSIFEHLSEGLVAHVPYVNDTVIVFVIDMPHMTRSITTENLDKWGVAIDEIHEIALENLDESAPELELNMQVIESAEGGKAVIVFEQDGYDAARLCLSDLHKRLAPNLGQAFYVATPARDMFVACSVEPESFVDRLSERVCEDFNRLPYPITEDLFLVTQDGVAGTKGKPVVPGMR